MKPFCCAGTGPAGTAAEAGLLGSDDDDVIAARVGRTPNAGVMRRKREVPKFRKRRRG